MSEAHPKLKTKPSPRPSGWERVECPSEECLVDDIRWQMKAQRPPVGLIRGRKKNRFITSSHTVVTGENKDRRIHRLMDSLYEIYRTDRSTEDGFGQLPMIGTLRANKSSEFHIYSTNEGIVKGFFVSFCHRPEDAPPWFTMTFVWVIPRFRGQGLFTQMCDDLLARRGSFYVDSPNEACQMALLSLGCSVEKGWAYRLSSFAKAEVHPAVRPLV